MNKIEYYIGRGFRGKPMFWFRVRGYGVVFKYCKRKDLVFSERMGFAKLWGVGNLWFRVLKPRS